MLIEAGQAAIEAAKSGNIMVSIPTGVVSSVATLLLYKGVPLIFNAMRGKTKAGNVNGACPKPGDADTCKEHSREIAAQKEAQRHTDISLKRIEDKVDDLPFKLIEVMKQK